MTELIQAECIERPLQAIQTFSRLNEFLNFASVHLDVVFGSIARILYSVLSRWLASTVGRRCGMDGWMDGLVAGCLGVSDLSVHAYIISELTPQYACSWRVLLTRAFL